MAGSLARTLEGHLKEMVTGPPLFDPTGNLPNMVVYPVFPETLGPDPPDVITLSQGMRRGVRLNDTGVVSQVHIDNPLPTSILVGESDILVGATQLRSVQFSCLVPPGRRASLPVNCVEAGQPTVYQAEFTGTEAWPWHLRSYKMEQLARHGDSHQHRIWEHIRDYLRGAKTTSSTDDVSAVFREYGADVESLSSLFPLERGQVGTVCAVGQELFIELFADPELLEDRYDETLRSALVEAVAHPTREVIPRDQVDELLDELAAASRSCKVLHSRSLSDSGRSLAFSDKGISGCALMSGGRLVHLSAHKRCWGFGRAFDDQVSEFSRMREAWEEDNAPFLAQLSRDYGRRSKPYRAFKERLKPEPQRGSSPSSKPPGAAKPGNAELGPVPMPLSPSIHEFFLRLFHK